MCAELVKRSASAYAAPQHAIGPFIFKTDHAPERIVTWAGTSRHSRGYGSGWTKLRELVLKRDRRLCQCERCKAEGRVMLATHVDHVVSKAKAKMMGWTQEQIDDPSNLRAISARCHKRKSMEERGYDYKERSEIGEDGYPVAEPPDEKQAQVISSLLLPHEPDRLSSPAVDEHHRGSLAGSRAGEQLAEGGCLQILR